MKRSPLIFAAAFGLTLAGSVQAQDLVGGITGQLRDLGFEQIEVRQTLLGRTRIVARSSEGQREIILNPNTGEILRDFWQAAPGQSATSRLVDRRNSNSGSDGSDRDGSDGASSDDGNDDSSGSGDDSDDRSGSDDRDGKSGSDDDSSDGGDDGDDDSDNDDGDDSDNDDGGDSDDSSDD